MKIAIIGAGYAGLALAIHLKNIDPNISVTIFHKDPIEKSTSSMSTGLLQPFVGKYIKKSWMADDCMEKAYELLDLCESTLGTKVYLNNGILRIANKPFQESVSKRVSRKYPENIWYEKPFSFHEDVGHPSLFQPSGVTVFSDLYVEGLKKVCELRGVQFQEREISSTKEISTFDKIILCVGAKLLDFDEGKDLPVEKIKGQALLLKIPKGLKPFPSMVSQGHISLCKDPNYCQVGSTYEREYTSLHPDEKAFDLIEQIAMFFPKIREFEVVLSKAGVRLSRKEFYKPIVTQASKKVWIFGALGSRGLLYHGFLANMLAKSILRSEKLLLEVLP